MRKHFKYLKDFKIFLGNFPGGPVVKTLCFHCRGHGVWPQSGNWDSACSCCCCCCWVTSVVSNSVRPHRRQPTRLAGPWESPGKNTGVGCHFLLQCMKGKVKAKSLSRVRLLATPWIAAHQAPPSMGFFSRQEYRSGLPLPSPLHAAVRGKSIWQKQIF